MYYRSQLCCFVFLSPPTDPTLTLTKLTQTLGSVDNWDSFRVYLDIPDSQYSAIEAQHTTKAALVEAVMVWYLTHHPAPSWQHVAQALYQRGEHDVLRTLRDQVPHLKGRSHSVCV